MRACVHSTTFLMLGVTAGCAAGLLPEVTELHRADAIVVLGNRPPVDESGRIRAELRRRVETGVQLFRRGLAPRLVMAGGPAPSGDVEADVMRDFAIRLGVPPHAILRERRSQDTIENARFSITMLCKNETEPCIPEVIIVSSPYHLRRARMLFECAGARAQVAPTPVPSHANYARSFAFRERFVWAYYGFIRPCRRASRR